ncbi:hemerythrin domain-containing protein [Segetibacter sp. 3557_3]|uniref:hemerythrin domain-containing protein n=1 Tax=Segetibacter sp. 3557_3 TaxID=2547429 RepID=UPI0010585BFF|nr:hemerythrin domain-containing protein [Segetibacter sp. 3557_3]TDH27029.1 hemerythrin domain-containing protein [Segetibacter sp. 3557_3]
MKKITPLKRSKHLVVLSRDHHQGLLVVWKLRQGLANHVAADTLLAFLRHEFRHHLEPHFQIEENQLFGALPADDALKLTAEAQHSQLRHLAREAGKIPEGGENIQENGYKLAEAFAMLLDDHIRFEERILFPHLEKMLTESQLEAIGAQLESEHALTQEVPWQQPFWLRK